LEDAKLTEHADFFQVPIDEKGCCVFHSTDHAWKQEQGIEQWFRQLFMIAQLIETDTIPFTFRNNYKSLDLRGVSLVPHEGEEELVLENLELKDTWDFQLEASTFVGDFKISRLSCRNVYFDFNHCSFQNVLIVHSHLKQLSFTSANLQSFHLIENQLEGFLEFSGTHLGSGGCHFQQNIFAAEIYGMGTYHKNLLIEENEFDKRVDFSNSLVFETSTIANNIFTEELNLHGVVFKEDFYFEDNALEGTAFFTAEQPGHIMFEREAHLQLAQDAPGKVTFEHINFSNIIHEHRQELLALAHENQVFIGSGCIKYRVQSPDIRLPIEARDHNLALAWARVFSEYLVRRSGYQIGIEVKEKRKQEILFFYFTDEDIPLTDWEDCIERGHRDFWQLNYAEGTPQELGTMDTIIDKASVLFKVEARVRNGAWKLNDTRSLWQAITTNTVPEEQVSWLHSLLLDRNSLVLLKEGQLHIDTVHQTAVGSQTKNLIVGNNKGEINVSSPRKDEPNA